MAKHLSFKEATGGSNPSSCTISPEERSYLTGFSFTDGSLGQRNGTDSYVGLYSCDLDIVEKIARVLKTDLFRYENQGNPFFSVRLNGEWIAWFKAQGLKHDKDELNFPRGKVELYPFLRGLIDGDGSIGTRITHFGLTLTSLRFLVRQKLAEDLILCLMKDGYEVKPLVVRNRLGKTKQLIELQIGGRAGTSLLRKLYEGSTIHLDRKFNRAQAIFETNANLRYRKYLERFN